jgi:hypothetical protein
MRNTGHVISSLRLVHFAEYAVTLAVTLVSAMGLLRFMGLMR